MRILDIDGNEIRLEDCDLEKGTLSIPTQIVKADAEPIDNITKFAWNDDDYEEVQYYTIPVETNEQRIDHLKAELSATDYVVIKIAEGAATAEEYAAVIADREAWRKEINELEGS